MVIGIIAITVFRIDGCRFEQSDFIIPHKGLFIDAMESRKLTDCKISGFFMHCHISLYPADARTVRNRMVSHCIQNVFSFA